MTGRELMSTGVLGSSSSLLPKSKSLVIRGRTKFKNGRERTSHLADKSVERSDASFFQRVHQLLWLPACVRPMFSNAVITVRAGETLVMFNHR